MDNSAMDVVATVVSDDLASAPFSGQRAAVVVVEALKGEEVVGLVVFGDLLSLRWESTEGTGELDVMARHATYGFTSMYEATARPSRVPAELVPMLQRGATAFRERLIKAGDRLRLRRRASDEGGGVRLDEVLSFVPSSAP